VFLRKERSDRGARRLSNKVEKIIDAAIKKIYLTAERPEVAAVVEEVTMLTRPRYADRFARLNLFDLILFHFS